MKKSTKFLLLQFGFAIVAMVSFYVAIILSPVPIPPRDMLIPGVLCVFVYAHLNEKGVEAIQGEFDGVNIS